MLIDVMRVSERENSLQSTRIIPFVLSQYSWIVYILIVVMCAFVFPRHHPSKLYSSQDPPKPWSHEEDPLVFTHVTDVHLAASEPFKIVNTLHLLNYMKYYNVSFHLISGDMVDDYGKKDWPKIGRQIPEDWEMWKKFVSEIGPDFKIIDLAGNHDMWGIDDPLSNNNLYLNYSYTYNHTNTPDMKSFYVRTIKHMNITFVMINTYRFPSIHPPYIYWSHPSREMLDEIEETISTVGKCWVVCHYPVDHNWWIKSSKGHTFEQLMQSENIEVLFSGHFHPKDPMIIHHEQGSMEIIGIGAYQFKGFGIVALDNGRFTYSTVRLTDTPLKYFMTHPIPVEQLSSHQIFNEKQTEIRVVSYSGPNETLKVSGDVEGTLSFSRMLKNGAALYTMPLNVNEGQYKIHVTGGECDISRTFYIGKQFKGFKEEAACYQRGLYITRWMVIPIFLCLLWMLIPFKGLESTETEQWIDGESDKHNWLMVLFAGPNSTRTRLLKLPKFPRYFLLALLLYPTCLPLHFFKPIHGLYGYSFLCFIVIGKHIMYDEWAIHMTFFYNVLVIMPNVILASTKKLQHKSFLFYVNYFFSILWFVGVNVINYRWVGESVVAPLLFVNPTFVVIPILIHIVFYFTLFKGDKKNKAQFQIDEMESAANLSEPLI